MIKVSTSGIVTAAAIGWLILLGTCVRAQLPPASFYQLRRDFDLFSSGYGSLTEDNHGFIWFGSGNGGGLYRYDGYKLTPFVFNPLNMKESISTSLIMGIYPVNDTLIYVATYFGYSTLNPVTGRIHSYNNKLDEVADSRITYTQTFLEDSTNHVLWISTGYGLAAIEHKTGRFIMKRPDASTTGIEFTRGIMSILKHPGNPDQLYLAGHDGLFTYTISLDHYERIACPLPGHAPPRVYGAALDPTGILWLSTMTGSLLRYNPATRQWREYPIGTSVHGTPGSWPVYKTMYVDSSRIWVSTRYGVGILHTDTGEFEAWKHEPENPSGLLPGNEYTSLLADRHGRLWVGSVQGIQYARQAFLPKPAKVKPVKVAITQVDIKPILEETQRPLLYTRDLTLNRDQRDITFHYVLPNPADPNAVRYEYMLEGSDKDWITTDQRTVRYGKLRGGDYVFRIKGREGKSGTWTPETSLAVSIPKKITEVLWFWIGLGAVLLAFAYLLFRYFITHAKKQATMKAAFEHQLSEIQMQALRAQMNPHFLFNSLNSIKYYAISKSKDETASYLSKFALLVRTILTNSKSKTISLQQELDALRLYIEIEHLRLEGKFDYRFDIDSSIHIRQTQIPPMILQPFVENAIWHGLMHKEGKGMLLVQVHDVGKQIQCVIEDNGIGRVRSAELKKSQMEHRKSEGMQITADRISLINRIYNIHTEVDVIDLQHPDGTAAGTRVVVHIPLIRDEEE